MNPEFWMMVSSGQEGGKRKDWWSGHLVETQIDATDLALVVFGEVVDLCLLMIF